MTTFLLIVVATLGNTTETVLYPTDNAFQCETMQAYEVRAKMDQGYDSVRAECVVR